VHPLEADALHKSYGGKAVLTDFSLSCSAGSITAVVGPNGSGKTTALTLMSGVARGSGQTLFYGKPLAAHPFPASVLGVMLGPKAFHPGRTARNHLRMLARGAGIPLGDVDRALDDVGLSHVRDAAPRSFSLGMAQRLSLASAILTRPRILFLDEPLNGLDIYSTEWLVGYLKTLAQDGVAVVVTSHILENLDGTIDRLVVLADGQTIAADSVDRLRQRFVDKEVVVRCDSVTRLTHELTRRSVAWRPADDGRVAVLGLDAREVWQVTADLGLVVLEIVEARPTLSSVLLQVLRREHPEGSVSIGGTL